ncbi:hypothetical protein ACFL6Y_07225 [Elusimicrobiota bacterium]
MTRKSAIMISLAVLVGMITNLSPFFMYSMRHFYKTRFPEYVQTWDRNGPFSMVSSVIGSDFPWYAGRINEASRHHLPYDSYIKGNKNSTLLSRGLMGFYALGRLHRLTGNMDATWMIAHFILSIAAFLMIYLLILRAGAPKEAAIFGAIAGILLYDLISIAQGSVKTFIGHSLIFVGNYYFDIGLYRIFRPALTIAYLLWCSYCAIRIAEVRTYKNVLLYGLWGGLAVYIHPTIAMAYGISLGLFMIMLWREEKKPPLALLASGILSFLVMLPWLSLNYPADQESLMLSSIGFGHGFSGISLIYAAGFIALYHFGKKKLSLLWCAGVSGAMFLLCNMQVITGYALPSYYWTSIGNLFIWIALISLAGKRIPSKQNWIWLTVLVTVIACGRAWIFALQNHQGMGLHKDDAAAFAWLKDNTDPDSVIATISGSTNANIPVYSHNKTLTACLAPYMSNIPLAENVDRLLYALQVLRISPEKFNEHSFHPEYLSGGINSFDRLAWKYNSDRVSLDRSLNHLFFFAFYPAQRTSSRIAKQEYSGKHYPVDYVWYGPSASRLAEKDFPKHSPLPLAEAFTSETVTIYKVKH